MLKNILSLLLSKFYSKQESALVASLALPDKSVSTSVSVTSGRDEYVAPNDGYLEFVTTVPNNGINVYGQVLQTSSYPREGRAAKLFVPIAKGKKIIFEVAADTSVMFYALVGGVSTLKKLILQGGGLCLNSLSSSLRRSSCRVKDRGFNTQLVRPRMQRRSALQPMVIGTRLHPAGTVMSHTLETPQALFWKSLTAAQVSLILNRVQDGTLFLYRKVKNLVISFQQIQQCPVCTLSLCGVQTNSAVGGASC